MAMSLATASDAVYPVHPGKPPDGHFDVIMLLDGTRHHLPANAGATVFEFKQATEQLFAPRPGMLATLEGVDYFLDFGYRAMDSMATILDNWCLLHRTCGGPTRPAPPVSISVAFTSPGFAIGNPYIDEDGGLTFRAETVACHHAAAKSPVLDTALDGRIRITFWNDSLVPELVLPSKGNSRGRVEYLVYDYLRRYKPTIRSCQVQLRTMEGNTFHRMLPGMRLLAAIPTAENITGPK